MSLLISIRHGLSLLLGTQSDYNLLPLRAATASPGSIALLVVRPLPRERSLELIKACVIGAGGLGDPIVTGLALNDTGLILQGAVPAALLALLTELLFEALERWLIPGSLKD